MRKGFTMIELIFVIVILGILAAVALPRLAATRDDARIASIKTDIGTATQAIPAWFTGQREASFLNSMSFDTSVWQQVGNTATFQWNVSQVPCVRMNIADRNITNGVIAAVANVASVTEPLNEGNFTGSAVLEITKGASTANICARLWEVLGGEQNITVSGRTVQW